MKKTIGIICCCVLLSSCDSTFIKFSPDYAFDNNVNKYRCAVILPDTIPVDYTGDVTDEFGKGDKDSLIDTFFRAELIKQLKKRTVFDSVYITTADSYESERLIEDNCTIRVPKAGQKIQCTEGSPDMILIVNDVSIRSDLNVSGSPGGFIGGTHFGPSFSSQKDLAIRGKFAIWDNVSQKTATYGYIESIDENQFAVSMEDWLSAISGFVTKMIEQTPLMKK